MAEGAGKGGGGRWFSVAFAGHRKGEISSLSCEPFDDAETVVALFEVRVHDEEAVKVNGPEKPSSPGPLWAADPNDLLVGASAALQRHSCHLGVFSGPLPLSVALPPCVSPPSPTHPASLFSASPCLGSRPASGAALPLTSLPSPLSSARVPKPSPVSAPLAPQAYVEREHEFRFVAAEAEEADGTPCRQLAVPPAPRLPPQDILSGAPNPQGPLPLWCLLLSPLPPPPIVLWATADLCGIVVLPLFPLLSPPCAP